MGLWLGRFTHPALISETTSFRVVSAIDPLAGAHRVVVTASERARTAEATEALQRLFRAHADPPHPVIARSLELGEHEGRPHVVFEFAGRVDLDRLVQIGADVGLRADYSEADGFSTTLRDALIANSKRHDEQGRPLCLGTFALGNVLFANDGSHALIGFGHNVIVYDELGRIVARNRFFQAPEIAVGGTPNVSSDIVGMIELTRAMMPFVKMYPALGKIIVGNSLSEDVRLVRLITWFEARVMRGPVWLRPPLDEIMAASNEIRALIHSVPDPAGFRAFVAKLLASERPDLFKPRRVLVLGPDASWFELGDEPRVSLERSTVQRRLMGCLARARLESPGRGVSVDTLIAMTWPGEKMLREAGTNRIYVAINNLRGTGLREVIERTEDGYRLSPETHLEMAREGNG